MSKSTSAVVFFVFITPKLSTQWTKMKEACMLTLAFSRFHLHEDGNRNIVWKCSGKEIRVYPKKHFIESKWFSFLDIDVKRTGFRNQLWKFIWVIWRRVSFEAWLWTKRGFNFSSAKIETLALIGRTTLHLLPRGVLILLWIFIC